MKTKQFYTLISTPSLIRSEDEEELEKIAKQYPFFSLAYTLLAYKKRVDKNSDYSEFLSKAAIYSGDRKKLYEFIIQPGLQEKIEENTKEQGRDEGEKEKIKEVEPSVKKESSTKSKTTESEKNTDLKKLEEDILTEAINSSIHLEIQAYRVEDAFPKEKEEICDIRQETAPTPTSPKPVDLTTQKMSFNEWLKFGAPNERQDSPPETPKKSRREEIADLVDQFISKEPKIIPKKTEFFSPANIARLSLVENDDFVTETLAKIYHNQKNYDRAIKAYQQLILKIPEKKSFFATQIDLIREEIKQSKK